MENGATLPGASGGTETGQGQDAKPVVVVVPENAPSVSETALQLTVAANLGIATKWGEQPMPLRPSHSGALQLAEDLLAEAIPLELARSAIYSTCLQSKLARPPRSLGYFAEAVRGAWANQQAQRALEGATVPDALPLPVRSRRPTTWDDLDSMINNTLNRTEATA